MVPKVCFVTYMLLWVFEECNCLFFKKIYDFSLVACHSYMYMDEMAIASQNKYIKVVYFKAKRRRGFALKGLVEAKR